MCKLGYSFSKSRSKIICFKHLLDTDNIIGGRNFKTRVTLSYGFYNKVARTPGYITPSTSHIFSSPRGWYFGVNLRIKCEQGATINPIQVQRAKDFYNLYNKEFVFPKYFNTYYDKGVDFFECLNIPEELLTKLKKEFEIADIEIVENIDNKSHKGSESSGKEINEDNFEDWLDKTLKDFEDIFDNIK